MKLTLARLLYAALALLALTGGGVVIWTQPSAFPLESPSFWAVSGLARLVAVCGLLACFAPFDRPQSAPRLAAPLAGIALGSGLMGLVLFTPSFVYFSGPLLIYAFLLRACARVLSQGPPDLELGTAIIRPEELKEEPPPPASGTGLMLLFLLVGAAAAVGWRPPAESARPWSADPEADLAPVVSRPPQPTHARRIATFSDRVEIRGEDMRVVVGLERPRLLIEYRGERCYLEPCLKVSAGSVDGFVYLPEVNACSLEPGGPAQVRAEEDERRATLRVVYPQGRATRAELAEGVAFMGRMANQDSIAGVIELELDLRRSRLCVDARSRLGSPLAVKAASLGYLHFPQGLPALRVGIGEKGVDWTAPSRAPNSQDPREFLCAERERVRWLRAKRGSLGPYKTLELGPFGSWFQLPTRTYPLLLVFPDWFRQASLAPSRSAGHALPANACELWSDAEGTHLRFDLGSSRTGPGRLLPQLPAGTYRNRIVLRPLRDQKPALVAKAELRRLDQAASAPPPLRQVSAEERARQLPPQQPGRRPR